MISFLTFLIHTLSSRAFAFGTGVGIPGSTSSGNYSTYCDYIKDLYRFALNAGFVLAALMIVFAGYRYLTSQGNTTAVNDAKDMLIGAIIGFVVLLLAKLIMNILGITNTCI